MEITLDELFKLEKPLLIDVRTPAEYEEDHLPGAINLPVLSNEERDRVGTIYHQESQFKARRVGAGLICSNVPEILEEIEARRTDDQSLALYCWRGGNRSKSLAIILDNIGYPTYRLAGGYKSYRQRVHNFFEKKRWTAQLVTIYGLTGAGKTRLLHALDSRGKATLDLEGAANHRGSAFGSVGLGEQPTQKKFENHLYQQLSETTGPVFTEGESRQIGRRNIPAALFEELISPPRVWLATDLEIRARRIREEYEWPETRDELISLVGNLKERLGKKKVNELQQKLRDNQVLPVVETLLEEYYDPAYYNSCPDQEEFDHQISGNNLDQATERLITTYS